tara:strand:+ start:1873 stop:3321 length:1449 start_codon:yes stop_codon:yes gene_type:complete
MKTSYLDFETSGLSRFFSQILTGFIKTCDEAGSPVDLFDEACAMESHRLPAPEALLVNNLDLRSIMQNQTLNSFLHQLFDYIQRNSPQIICGHNVYFDYQMAHSGFYQNLISSNIYQWRLDGNTLFDSLCFARALFAFGPNNNFKVKVNESGIPFFDLASLCQSNGIKLNAHIAKNDVLALEELMELMRKESPEIYDLSLKCSIKNEAMKLVNEQVFFLAALGTYNHFSPRVLVPICVNPSGTDVVCFDLLSEISEIEKLSPLQMTGFLGSKISKKQPILRLPLNKGIFIASSDLFYKNKQAEKLGFKTLFRKASKIRRNKDLKNLALESLSWRENDFENVEPEVEEEIYCRGFPSNVEKTFVNSFNLCPPEDRAGLTKAYAQRLNCDRYVRLANRVLLEHFPSSCSEQEQNQYFEWIHNRLFSYPTEGYEPKWDTIYTCLSQIEALKKKYPNKLERIEEIRLFYVRIGSVAGLDLHNVFGH